VANASLPLQHVILIHPAVMTPARALIDSVRAPGELHGDERPRYAAEMSASGEPVYSLAERQPANKDAR
jgi:hypothetical protein